MSFKVLALVLAVVVTYANAHGWLKEPVARTSIHLRPEFQTDQPYWWNNEGVMCDDVVQDQSYSNCGRCGEAFGNSDASQGGIYDKKVVVATYSAGSIIEVAARFGAPHYGHYEIELCASEVETDTCFTKLQIVGGNEEVRDGNRICVPYYTSVDRDIIARVLLPAGVRCNRCTIRWTYRTSYQGAADWDMCDNPRPAQTFRNCADVRIQ